MMVVVVVASDHQSELVDSHVECPLLHGCRQIESLAVDCFITFPAGWMVAQAHLISELVDQ